MTVTQTAPQRRTPPDADRAGDIRKAALLFLGLGFTPDEMRGGALAPVVAEVADAMTAVLAADGAR